LYSADIARSPDGKLWIISNRTQAPSGYDSALENRDEPTALQFFNQFAPNCG